MIVRDNENGFMVDLGDEVTFEKRILQLIDDQTLQNRFVETGKQEQHQYSSEVVTSEIKKILEEHLPSDVLNLSI